MQFDSTQTYYQISPSDYFSRCPQARIRAYGALWTWDVSQQEYTLAQVENVYFTAANPTAPMSALAQPPIPRTCGYAFLRVQSNGDPPSIYPTALTGDSPNVFSYWGQHGLGYVMGYQTNDPSPAQLAACDRPTISPSPTP